jgi:hypothetical protein
MDFEEMMEEVNRLSAAVQDRYKTTPATAAECFEQLNAGLMEMDVEPDCVGMWQTLLQMTMDEEEWDTLSAEEQQNQNLPKGKRRKKVSTR